MAAKGCKIKVTSMNTQLVKWGDVKEKVESWLAGAEGSKWIHTDPNDKIAAKPFNLTLQPDVNCFLVVKRLQKLLKEAVHSAKHVIIKCHEHTLTEIHIEGSQITQQFVEHIFRSVVNFGDNGENRWSAIILRSSNKKDRKAINIPSGWKTEEDIVDVCKHDDATLKQWWLDLKCSTSSASGWENEETLPEPECVISDLNSPRVASDDEEAGDCSPMQGWVLRCRATKAAGCIDLFAVFQRWLENIIGQTGQILQAQTDHQGADEIEVDIHFQSKSDMMISSLRLAEESNYFVTSKFQISLLFQTRGGKEYIDRDDMFLDKNSSLKILNAQRRAMKRSAGNANFDYID